MFQADFFAGKYSFGKAGGRRRLFPFFVKVDAYAEQSGKQRAEGSGQPHGIKGGRKINGGQPCAGNADKDNGKEVLDKREQGTTVGTEEAAETKMNSCRGTIQNIGPQILCSHGDYFGIMGEKAQNIRRNKLKKNTDQQSERNGDGQPATKSFLCPLRFARADILCGDGRDGRKHGGRNEKKKADDFFHDTYTGCGHHAPAVGNGRNKQEGNLNKSILTGDRNADF